jgi:hypothetical protein
MLRTLMLFGACVILAIVAAPSIASAGKMERMARDRNPNPVVTQPATGPHVGTSKKRKKK